MGDKEAKEAYKEFLISTKEYSKIEITTAPADIIATKKTGEIFYFEIKATSTKKKDAWWGVSVSEWIGARENKERYFFVLAIKRDEKYEFVKISPKELLKFNTVPPFRSTFRFDLIKNKLKEIEKTTSVKLTEDKINRMNNLYMEFKKEGNKKE